MMDELVLNEVEGKEFFYNENGLFPSLSPIFQYSIIPFGWHKYVEINRLLISMSCKIFNTSIYMECSDHV
jgi:hypothetical protein